MERVKRALDWLIPLLNERNIPFHITGGFAAHLYGACRPVNDIDIDMPASELVSFVRAVHEYVESSPARHRDTTWDLYSAALDYHGQLIDLTGDEQAFIRNKSTNEWDPIMIDLDNVVWVEAFGHRLPVQNPLDLITYKQKIAYEEGKHLDDVDAVLRYVEYNRSASTAMPRNT